jgi:hypothetical protein
MTPRKSLWSVVFVAAIVAAVPMGWAVQVQAQGAPPASPQPGQMTGAQVIEGKVVALDPSGKKLALEDGTVLMVPEGARLPADIKEGSTIRASFEERFGEKELTGIEAQKP